MTTLAHLALFMLALPATVMSSYLQVMGSWLLNITGMTMRE